jgi:3-methyladenine DNA glycosylase AlkD
MTMVVKALSWALRALAVKEPRLVSQYLRVNEERLAARVLRETRNKLRAGVKNPKQTESARIGRPY